MEKNKNRDIEEEVERTMHSLDGIEKGKTDVYFFARVEARLHNERESASFISNVWVQPRYMLGVAAATLIILFNIFSVVEYQQSYQQNESVQQTDEAAILAEEYELNVPVIYDINEDNNGY